MRSFNKTSYCFVSTGPDDIKPGDFIMRYNMLWPADRIRLFVHYTISLSSLCKLICRHWTYEITARYICRVCEKDWTYSLNYPLFNIWGCMFSVCPIPSWWLREYIALSYYHHQIGSMDYYPLFRIMSWNNGMRCMSLYILMMWYYIHHCSDWSRSQINTKHTPYVALTGKLWGFFFFRKLTDYISLPWRHNARDSVSIHLRLGCLLNRLFVQAQIKRKCQSFASLAFVRELTSDRWIPLHKGQQRGKCFHLMTSSCDALLS